MARKKLRVFSSLGETLSVGWERDDLPMVHVFAQARPGEQIVPSNGRGGDHWPCPVCDSHGYSEEDYRAQIVTLMKDGE